MDVWATFKETEDLSHVATLVWDLTVKVVVEGLGFRVRVHVLAGPFIGLCLFVHVVKIGFYVERWKFIA
jgi:predicted membrane protein